MAIYRCLDADRLRFVAGVDEDPLPPAVGFVGAGWGVGRILSGRPLKKADRRWGVWDGGVMSWKATDLCENEARPQAADLNVTFNQYGQRSPDDRRQVSSPVPVELAAWTTAGELDYWVRDQSEWWGRVRQPDGHHVWIRAMDLRRAPGIGKGAQIEVVQLLRR